MPFTQDNIYNLIMKNYLFLAALTIAHTATSQVPSRALEQEKPVLLLGGTAHLGNGKVIESSALAFAKGKLTVVSSANEIEATDSFEVIDVKGQHIYPGLILTNSSIGLSEVGSIRAMRDQRETGTINPNVRSVISYNSDSEVIPTLRFNGILLAETTPQGGLISGTSSVMEMEGWNWEDATHTEDVGIHLHWPVKTRIERDFNTFTITFEPNENYAKQVDELKKHFDDAKAYGNLEQRPNNLKLEAMQGLFTGVKRLFIHAHHVSEIVESVKMAQSRGVKHIVIYSGEEALHAAPFLRDHKIPVVIPPTHSLPARPDEPIDRPYELPHLLNKAGIKVTICETGDPTEARNLPFYAGTAVAYGMDKEEALKTITSNPASVLGIDDRAGTLEVGKDATLFVSEGDALDIRSNSLTHAFISGKKIILAGKQQLLYQTYSKKYGH